MANEVAIVPNQNKLVPFVEFKKPMHALPETMGVAGAVWEQLGEGL